MFLVEIKCPYAKRNFYPRFAALEHCYEDENKVLHLDPKDSWYSQIQGQLGICSLKLCKLVVYTNKGIRVVDVPFDEKKWDNMKTKLSQFYMEHLGPHTLTILKNNNSLS